LSLAEPAKPLSLKSVSRYSSPASLSELLMLFQP